jgi:AcrR family transcriptional regulator
MSRPPAEPRPYLRAGERRSQLLGAAATVVGREGLANLTVAAVATEAGVSRQWVYEHFSDLDDLYRALILDRFAALDADIDAAKNQMFPTELATFAARQVFALVPADRRILRALVDGAGQNRPELAGIEAELRERILERWSAFLRTTGHGDPEARAVVWAIVNAIFGLADQIEREALAVETAVRLLEQMLASFTTPPAAGRRGHRRSPRVGVTQPHGTGASHAH